MRPPRLPSAAVMSEPGVGGNFPARGSWDARPAVDAKGRAANVARPETTQPYTCPKQYRHRRAACMQRESPICDWRARTRYSPNEPARWLFFDIGIYAFLHVPLLFLATSVICVSAKTGA